MRILTRGDMDGLTASVLLTLVEDIKEIRFAHPKDVQDGLVKVTKEDIIVNLPFVPGCGKWFDHHISEDAKLETIGAFEGSFEVAPSAARVVNDFYRSPKFGQYAEMLEKTDRIDAANLAPDEVAQPAGWILLAYTLDPRTGLGPEFQKYFRWLVEYVKEVPVEKVLQHPEVKKRADRVMKEQEEFNVLLKQHSKLDGQVIVTDFRSVNMREAPVGNRFLVFTLYPQGHVEARILKGKDGRTVVACGHSIFNRACKVNVGTMLAEYGGGGHYGAGTAQLDSQSSEAGIAAIIARLKANQP